MIRASNAGTAGKGTSSFDTAPLSLWTPRNAVGSSSVSNLAAQQQQQIQIPFPGRLFHKQMRNGQLVGGRSFRDRHVEVLNKLPSLYNKIHNKSLQQQQQQKQLPEPLPLLHGSKRMRQSQLQHKQQQQQQQQQSAIEEHDVDAAEPVTERSRFRISVLDRPQQEQQEQQQQQPVRTVPMAYFSRNSASLRSTRCVDVDARSCDERHPDRTVAYSRAADYIRDNELMSAAKARLIWRWMDEMDDSMQPAGRLFTYDKTSGWFIMAA